MKQKPSEVEFQDMCAGFVAMVATDDSHTGDHIQAVIHRYFEFKSAALDILKKGILRGEVAPEIIDEVSTYLVKMQGAK